MDHVKVQATTQFTLEEDVNIPEQKPDVSHIHLEKGEILIDEVKPSTDYVMVRGRMQYAVLYHTMESGCGLVCLMGKIPFEEKIHVEGVTPQDSVTVEDMVEDITVTIINSRKLNVQALVGLTACVEELYDEEIPIACKGEEKVEYHKAILHPMQIVVHKKDIVRVKEEVTLPSNYPNIFQILWKNMNLRDVELKVAEDKIVMSGDVCLFIMYESEGEEHSCRCYETVIPFHEAIECHGCGEGMIPDISYRLGQQEVSVRPDFDGEQRCVGLELVIDICARVYEEECVEMVEDIYAVRKDVEVKMAPGKVNKLLGCVTAKTKVTDRIKVPRGPVFQLVHSEGCVVSPRKSVVENGILLEGVVPIKVMYITEGDENPYGSVNAQIPFTYTMEMPGVTADDLGEVKADLEQLQVSMLDGEEMDVKMVLRFSTVVFHGEPIQLISDVEVKELDRDKLSALPGMVMYVVHPGDNLWNIGKKYYVSVEHLREWNQLENDDLKVGQKLLIVKGMS